MSVQRFTWVAYFSLICSGSSPNHGTSASGAVPTAVTGSVSNQAWASAATTGRKSSSTRRLSVRSSTSDAQTASTAAITRFDVEDSPTPRRYAPKGPAGPQESGMGQVPRVLLPSVLPAQGDTMTTLHIEHAITAFPTWHAAFRRYEEVRTRSGVLR